MCDGGGRTGRSLAVITLYTSPLSLPPSLSHHAPLQITPTDNETFLAGKFNFFQFAYIKLTNTSPILYIYMSISRLVTSDTQSVVCCLFVVWGVGNFSCDPINQLTLLVCLQPHLLHPAHRQQARVKLVSDTAKVTTDSRGRKYLDVFRYLRGYF